LSHIAHDDDDMRDITPGRIQHGCRDGFVGYRSVRQADFVSLNLLRPGAGFVNSIRPFVQPGRKYRIDASPDIGTGLPEGVEPRHGCRIFGGYDEGGPTSGHIPAPADANE